MRQLDLQDRIVAAIGHTVRAEAILPPALPFLARPDRLAIHARHYRASLTAVLASAYPAVKRLTGEGFFAFAAAQFIAAEPPLDPILDRYGAGFAGFLARLEACASLRWLPHVARFEWAMHALSQMPAAGRCSAGPADPVAATTLWSQAAALFAAPYRVTALTALDVQPGDDGRGDSFLLLVAGAASIAVHPLSRAEFVCLDMLSEGGTLGDAIATGLTADPGFEPASILRTACQSGAIASFH